ncbi:NTH [Phaffia rhodozyma]|uniref:NTH n=1 Tax=Phaffia rhodozyma TaxID=264483 RepID=A0A0F7SIB1_PHARH|nr:NTH [Phaffia rhodozyma]
MSTPAPSRRSTRSSAASAASATTSPNPSLNKSVKKEEDQVESEIPLQPSPLKRKTPEKPQAKTTPVIKKSRSGPTLSSTKKPSPATSDKNTIEKGNTPPKPKFAAYLQTPYPDYARPTPEDCKLVVEKLGSIHGIPIRPGSVNKDISGAGVNCGAVPSVMDALIRTILSQNTSNSNSSRAYASLLATFGPSASQKKAVDLVKVHQASQQEVMESIKSGGLANVKSKVIKQVLQQVWDRNLKHSPLSSSSEHISSSILTETNATVNVKPEYTSSSPDSPKEETKPTKEELASPPLTPLPEDTEDNKANLPRDDIKLEGEENSQEDAAKLLSLDYVHQMDDEHAMKELESFKGVGPKTASCVLLFCLNRDSFAVDTHVFRLSKQLGWVPAKANRETTYEHLDVRIPGELKYALHVLLIAHGKSCSRCAAGHTTRPSLGPCPLVNLSSVSNKSQKSGAKKGAKATREDGEEGYGESEDEELDLGSTLKGVPDDVKQEAKDLAQKDLKEALTVNHGG